jgi:hypothetical protein
MTQALVGYLLIAALFTAAFAMIVWLARFRDPDELWIRFIKRVSIVIVVAALTTVAFALFYDRAQQIGPRALVILQIAKDAPGLFLVATCVGHIRSSSVSLPNDSPYSDRILAECSKVLVAGLLASIVVGTVAGQTLQLEDGAGHWATLYRACIYLPMVFYSAVLSLAIFREARSLGRLDPEIRRRYRMFAFGISTWVLLSLDHFGRPVVVELLNWGPQSLGSRTADMGVTGLWVVMVVSLVYGFAAKPRLRTRADRALAATNAYQSTSSVLVARLDDPDAPWRADFACWQRSLAELAETVRECCRDSGDCEDEADRQARLAKTGINIIAMLQYDSPDNTRHTRNILEDHLAAYEGNVSGIPEESPAKRALLEDRVALVARDSLLLVYSEELDTLEDDAPWVQVAALVSAELGLLPGWKSDEILRPGNHILSPDVSQALKDVRFLFRDRPVNI